MDFASQLLLTVRGVFHLELVVPSDWEWTIMKGGPTQKGLEMRHRERKKENSSNSEGKTVRIPPHP